MARHKLATIAVAATLVVGAGAVAAQADGSSEARERRAQVGRRGAAVAGSSPASRPDVVRAFTGRDVAGARYRSAEALPAEPPAFTAPADGASVSDTVQVSVTSTAEKVRFSVDGVANPPVEVAVSGGTASTVLPLYGRTGVVSLRVDHCVGTDCGAEVTRSVNVTNTPISIQVPAPDATVGTSFALSATSSGGLLEVLIDGVFAAFVSSPYQSVISTADVSSGTHSLDLIQCDASPSPICGGPAASRLIVVRKTQSPVINSLLPKYFSPNQDGVQDTTKVTWTLDSTSNVKAEVRNATNGLVRGPVSLGNQSTGSHSWTWNGRSNSGAVVAGGNYYLILKTTTTISGSSVPGSAAALAVVDVRSPGGALRDLPGTFYPVKDGYRDTTILRVDGNEPLSSARLSVLKNGSQVFTRTVAAGGDNRIDVTWNGRTNGGRLLPAGTFRYRYYLTDRAGNKAATRLAPVVASGRKLVRKSGQQIVTPRGSKIDALIGMCSEVVYPARPGWPGSFEYLSNINVCPAPDPEETLAITRHQITVPRAIKYGPVRVDGYGARDLPGYPDVAVILYDDRYGEISDYSALLRPAEGWHSGDSAPGSRIVNPHRKIRWWAGTIDNNYYDIKSFRVSYTYFVLG